MTTATVTLVKFLLTVVLDPQTFCAHSGGSLAWRTMLLSSDEVFFFLIIIVSLNVKR